MKFKIEVPVEEDGIWLTDSMVYRQEISQGPGKHGAVRKLHVSVIRPYDVSKRLPCIVWLCGGGWRHMEYQAYVPQLTWLAKRGYAVAFVEYTCLQVLFPQQLIQIKAAIRFLKANADKLQIDKTRFGIMGASAGAHLAAMVGVSNGKGEYDRGDYLEETSDVHAACTWYLPSDLFEDRDPEAGYTQKLLLGYPVKERPDEGKKACPALLVDSGTVPFLLLHGTADRRVPCNQSEEMYEALQKHGIPSDLYLIDGAGHGGKEFLQEPVCGIIADYFDHWFKKTV